MAINRFDIRDFGAAADAHFLNTGAIQRTIDACHDAGGGTVYCPPGVFVSGTLWLKSHVTLHLEAGCTLLGSGDRADYIEGHSFPESRAFSHEQVSDAHLIIAYRAENVGITGRGMIDGNSRAFMPFLRRHEEGQPVPPRKPWAWRPGQMVFFCRCRDVLVEGIHLNNAPYWTLFLHGCDRAHISALTVESPYDTPCGDGIDIDCCRDVTIESCLVSSGDDCITLRANASPLGKEAFACENVAVTNCILRSRCNAIRIGVGAGTIRNCVLANIVIRESATGVNMISRYAGTVGSGSEIRNIRLSNLEIDAHMPIYISTGSQGAAPVCDITLSDVTAHGGTPCFIGGTLENPATRITFRNVDITLRGGAGNKPPPSPVDGNPEWEFRTAGVPYGLCVAEASDILLQHVRVRWAELAGTWEHALFARNTQGLSLSQFDAASPPGGGHETSAIRCVGCRDVHLQSCRAAAGTQRFLCVDDSPPEAIVRLIGNDFSQAQTPIACDAPILENGNVGLAAGSSG